LQLSDSCFELAVGLHKAKPPQVCGLRGFAMKEMKFLNQRTQSEVEL
jgi:hypothetical protein